MQAYRAYKLIYYRKQFIRLHLYKLELSRRAHVRFFVPLCLVRRMIRHDSIVYVMHPSISLKYDAFNVESCSRFAGVEE